MKTVKITKATFAFKEISIGALDGKKIILQSKDIFKSFIDPNFYIFGLNRPSRPTKEIKVVVSEMTADGTFFQIFKGINPDLDKSVLTVSQIIEFSRRHSWLRLNGFGTFFLTKKISIFQGILSSILKLFFKRVNLGKYFVVRTSVGSEGLNVHVGHFENKCVWDCGDCFLVVSPRRGS